MFSQIGKNQNQNISKLAEMLNNFITILWMDENIPFYYVWGGVNIVNFLIFFQFFNLFISYFVCLFFL
jgi:hypothetical protein